MSKVRYRRRNRTARRLAAQERQAEAAKRTPEQQFARLDAAHWRAKKERARLERQIKAKKEAA